MSVSHIQYTDDTVSMGEFSLANALAIRHI